jgi:peptidoglycan/LPS O-acetylase OafA/YrhL
LIASAGSGIGKAEGVMIVTIRRNVLVSEAIANDKPKIHNGIQCLRFIAALLVVIFHATYYTYERLSPSVALWANGGLGVDIFFIISGFVMAITADRFRRPRGWVDFAIRRLIRVMPLYWLATTAKLMVLLLAPALVLHSTIEWDYILKSYLLIPAYADDGTVAPFHAVGWTLLFEMFFYLIFTLALAFPKNPISFCGGILIICALGSAFKPNDAPAYMVYFDPIVLEFLVGMIFASGAKRWTLHLGACLGLCAIGAAFILAWPAFSANQFGLERMIGPALLVLGVIGLEPHVRYFPDKFVFLGTASYSLYITHPLIAPFVPAVLRRLGLIWPSSSVLLCIALAIFTSLIVFVFIEDPMNKWLGRRVNARQTRPGANKLVEVDE